MKRLALIGASILALSTAAPALAHDAAMGAAITPPPLQFTHRELANGLDVYAMPNPSAGTVTIQMWYNVGGKDDPQGRSGFAHLFEHILSRKTTNLPYGMISTMVENAGGSRNASTGQDFTNYYETVPPQYLERMLWAHAERMAEPVVDEAVFQAERSIVKEELRQRVLAPPYGRFQRFVIGDNSFDNSIYRRSVIGSIEELDSAVIDDARAFHEAYYRPAQATLIVSGNFDPAELDRLVDQYFGGIRNPDRPVPVFERPVEAPRTGPRHVTAYAPNVPLPAVGALYPGVAADDPDNAALDVLSAIMSRGQSSRLYQSLVYRQQLATNASFGVDSMEEDGSIDVTAVAAAGKEPAAVQAALDAELTRVRDEPVTPAELAEAKTELLAQDLRSRETPDGRAFLLGQALVSENNPNAPDERVAAIQRVTAADVQRVARRFLNDTVRVTVEYRDESQRPADVAEDSWRNPAPVPTYLTVPPAILPPNELLPEDQRMAPPPLGQARAIQAPTIAERTLPNGLRVIVAKSTALPIMSAQLVINGGASADPADRPGLADFTTGLARRGAAGQTAPQIAARLEAMGAQVFGGAGPDAVTVSASAPIASADALGGLLADMIERPDFAPAELERSRTQATNGLRVAMRDPAYLADAVLQRVAFGAAPYGAPSSGTQASLAAITRDEVQAYHDRWWRPDNATLIITGGMDAEAAFAFAQTTFGAWDKPAEALPTVTGRAGSGEAPRIVVIDLPGAGQAAIAAGVRAPRRTEADFYPLSVANAVIGGGQGGFLFHEIRSLRGLSYGARSSLGSRADHALLAAATQTKNESAAEVVDLVLTQFDRLKTEAVTEVRVGERETFVTGNYLRALETTGGLGGVLASTVQQGLPLSDVAAYPERIAATDAASLRQAVIDHVGSDKAYVVVVGDASQFLDALRAAHPQVQVIRAADLDLASPGLVRP
ncbi:MAG: insulinase family protein [Caulobacterales bacterium]|nr:insulinase family protein [Caulobacterales bacterium]